MTTEAITPLRQRMIEDMNARKLCAGTQRGHIRSCKRAGRHARARARRLTADTMAAKEAAARLRASSPSRGAGKRTLREGRFVKKFCVSGKAFQHCVRTRLTNS
jgi:hypothetical protein